MARKTPKKSRTIPEAKAYTKDKLRESISRALSGRLLTFDEVIAQANTPNVLLGNGFSIAYNKDRFSFTTLLDSAVRKGIIDIKSEVYKVFEKMATADFESVMRAMDNSRKILEVYDADSTLLKKIVEHSKALKGYLVEIVTNNHPAKSTELSDEEKVACLKFLQNFDKIYTLNYDLLLYWATMQDEAETFTDGFANTADSVDEGYVVYQNAPQSHRVLYLHGALHYFDSGHEVIKKTYNNTDIVLIEQVRDALAKDIYPIFISEGTSEQKETKITHNSYLMHCYNSLRRLGAKSDLVIFGAKLAENDDHILKAVLTNGVKRIYLGVKDEMSAGRVRAAFDSHNAKADEKHQKELILFDYRTVNVWGRK